MPRCQGDERVQALSSCKEDWLRGTPGSMGQAACTRCIGTLTPFRHGQKGGEARRGSSRHYVHPHMLDV